MKTKTILKSMYAVTAVFVCAAVIAAVIALTNRSELRVVWSDTLADAQQWSDNSTQLRDTLNALFPERARGEDDPSNEILPNFPTLVNINTAGSEELCQLPGIGEHIAAEIIRYRQEHGSFQTIDEIMDVSGIGEKKFEAMRELITV